MFHGKTVKGQPPGDDKKYTLSESPRSKVRNQKCKTCMSRKLQMLYSFAQVFVLRFRSLEFNLQT